MALGRPHAPTARPTSRRWQRPRRRRYLQPGWADACGHRPQGNGTALGHPHAQTARPIWTAAKAPSTASPSAPTGGRSRPPAMTRLCGSGTPVRASLLGEPLNGGPRLGLRRRLQLDGQALVRRTRRDAPALGHTLAKADRPRLGRPPRLRQRRRLQPGRAHARLWGGDTTERYGSGIDARLSHLGQPLHRPPGLRREASPSARTGARSPPSAETGRSGSGKASSGGAGPTFATRSAAFSSAT